MKINTVVLLMNNLRNIYKHDKLKYGVFTDSLLAAMRF